MLAEVTLDSTETWGMDVSVGPFGGEGYRVGSAAAGAGVATALGVPNLSVSSSDFNILVRSLEEQGKLEVLSNPQVMVNNLKVAANTIVIYVGGRSDLGGSELGQGGPGGFGASGTQAWLDTCEQFLG